MALSFFFRKDIVMFRFEYDECLMYFVGLHKVVINKYNNGEIFIKIFNDTKDKDKATVIVRCSEYKIIDKSEDLEVKEYLNGME